MKSWAERSHSRAVTTPTRDRVTVRVKAGSAANCQGRSITTHRAELISFLKACIEPAGVITCMGDTLTHLDSVGHVREMVHQAARLLDEGGRLVLSWRDLTVERTGPERFIHVRSDATRSLSCFLEYFPDHVMVYDILLEKADKSWTQRVSSYPKLRLSADAVVNTLRQQQFSITAQETKAGMIYVCAEKAKLK
jgi:hypothetical protein